MAKNKNNNNVSNDKVKYENEYDAHYGTKSNMIVATLDNINMKDIDENCFFDSVVIAKDSNGLYATGKSFVDAPILDPFRMYKRIHVKYTNGAYEINK